MTDNVIEQAARAICVAEGMEPDEIMTEPDGRGGSVPADPCWVIYTDHARALADAGLLRQEPPTREQVYGALLNVLANAANYPEERDVDARMLGLDVKPLTDKAADAVLALLDQAQVRLEWRDPAPRSDIEQEYAELRADLARAVRREFFDQPPARDVAAEARAEAEERWPESTRIRSDHHERRYARRRAFIEGATWATGGAR